MLYLQVYSIQETRVYDLKNNHTQYKWSIEKSVVHVVIVDLYRHAQYSPLMGLIC